ncbi:MAG TPA: alpha-2-macroglobulin [Zoogloea sp.]|nr:alpha-2-macroglobulin [Zoogloea sp.]
MTVSARRGFAVASILIAVVVAIVAGLALFRPGAHSDADAADGPFELVELANRDFDGSPALALTFSQPLDSRHSYDSEIQVFEMPPRDGEARLDNDTDEDGDPESRDAKDAATVSTAPADVASEGGKLVKGAWTVGENPRLLFFPHIKPRSRYVVRVAAGLPSRDGQKLEAESRFSVLTAAVPPTYYFASRGMVLPAGQNGGLPVVTVNVPEVDIQFLRVKSDQLPRFLDRVIAQAKAPKPQPGSETDGDEEGDYPDYNDRNRRLNLRGAVSNWDLDSLHTLTDSVYSGRFLTEQKADRRSVTFIPVEDVKELREPGIYIAVMSQPKRFRYDYQVSYFYVSDLGLHVRLFEKSADAFVSSLTDGKAQRGVEIAWLDENGKTLARGETDGDGRAAFAERPKNARVIVARKGNQLSLVTTREPALDLSEFDIAGLPGRAVRLFAWSGRNLYRPGENFDLSVLARDADGRPLPPQPVQAILKRPDGKSQFTATWQPDAKFGGYYRRVIELPADAPTGSWQLELRADPADKLPTTTYRFGVEEFLPERMKLELTPSQASFDPGQPYALAVQGSYLYGAPAAGNRLLGVVQYERQKNPLSAQLPGFEFGDSNEDSARSRVELEETLLDDAGKGSFDIDLAPVAERQSPYTVRTTVSLLESGGRPVIRSVERIHWPAPVLVGIRPLFQGDYAREGSQASFEVIRADRTGKLGGATLPARLFREDRNYYWRFDDQRGWHSGFTESDELVFSTSVSVPAGGRGQFGVPVKYGRYRVEIADPATGKTLKYRFYAGWNARQDEEQGTRPDRVALKLDKPAYRDGDTVKLAIAPPHGGQALVTVEGDRTLWVKRLTMPEAGTTLEIPLDKEWRRHDLYVSVLVLRPGSEGEKVTPARAVGLAHIPLERAERKLAVSLEAPKKILPETTLKVKVRVPAAKGQAALLTLSAVDVGILNITRFPSPDPHANFFGKLRYNADQYDIYGRLIEKMGGRKGKLKFGGDSAPKPTNSLPKKVRLVDIFSGPVALDAQGEAEVLLPVPDFNGSLRLMAVVATADRFGSSDAEIVVAAPLVAELSTPRFLTVGDSAVVALDLHNLSGKGQTLKIELVSPDGLTIRNATRSLTLADQQRQTLRFPVEAGSAFGLAGVQVKVNGGPIPLTRQFGLQVQAPTPRQQINRRFTIAPGETLVVKDAETGGFLRSSVEAHLSLSDQPPIDVRSAVQGLLVYPYGCAEQTTSTAYPHVFVDEEAARRFGLKPFTREQRAAMLEKSIARLGAMQAPNGGFSLWGNVSEYEYWLSAYVTNFLLDAREQGFNVPAAMKQKAGDFLLGALQEGVAGLPSSKPAYNENSVWQDRHYAGSGRFGVLAYGGYVLARESRAPLATLRQLFELRSQAHSGLALIHLGIALKLMGDETRAGTAIAEGIAKPRDSGYWWGDYGSPLRDAALSYTLLQRHRIKADNAANLVALAAAELEKNRWTSTQEKLALFLLGRELGNPEKGSTWSAELTDKNKAETISGPGGQTHGVTAASLADGLKIRNTHKDKLFVELAVAGHPSKMPASRSDVIALKREIYDANGKLVGDRPLQVGESVLVRIHVMPKIWVSNGLVVDRIPAGLEIENLNIAQGEKMGTISIAGINPADAMADRRIQHVEFRDDRFAAAVRLQGELNLFYRARVVTPGKFVIPPLYAEDMYRPDTYGLADSPTGLSVIDGKER